jgi:hypothetical protein
MQDTKECIIPPEALTDPKRRELLRAWVAHQNLHVSIFIPDDWGAKPAHWGIAFTDIIRHLADAYQKQHGIAPEETIRQIREMIDTEFASPTSGVTGDFVE